MRWTPGGESQDIEDRRDEGGGGFGGFGGRGASLGGLLVLGVLSLVFGRDFITPFLGTGGGTAMAPRSTANPARTAAERTEVQFVSFVLDDAQSTWSTILSEQARVPYRHAKLVLFRDAIGSACGFAEAASGPFYCPEDEKVYLDLWIKVLPNWRKNPGSLSRFGYQLATGKGK